MTNFTPFRPPCGFSHWSEPLMWFDRRLAPGRIPVRINQHLTDHGNIEQRAHMIFDSAGQPRTFGAFRPPFHIRGLQGDGLVNRSTASPQGTPSMEITYFAVFTKFSS